MNVFVFPTCNEPGLEAIQALSKSNKITLFGGSSYDVTYDPSRALLKNYVHCPGYDEPGFAESFKDILRRNQIDVVVPAWDLLVAEFARWRVEGTVFVTPRAEIATALLSKRDTYERLQGVVPVPTLYTPEDASFPVFAKPDRSSGSRDIFEVRTPDQLRDAVERGLLLCEFLPGEEYTVDCISGLDGGLLFSNIRVRGKIGRGIALGTKPVHEPGIQACIERIAETLRIEGPWFAQFKKNAGGDPVLMEINARVAGSMTLTRLCGINIPLIAVFLYTGHEVRIPQPREEVLLNRSLRNVTEEPAFDWVIWDWDDTILRKDGKPDPDVVACLYDLHNRGIHQLLLSKNPALDTLLEDHRIPHFFVEARYADDKVGELESLIADHGIDPTRCIMVNDSYIETFAIQERCPPLRTVTPDALDRLGREKLA